MSKDGLVEISVLDDMSAGKNKNSVEGRYGGKTVGDGDESQCAKVTSYILEDENFRSGIEAGSSLIQNENLRPLQQCSRNRKPLTLSVRKLTPSRPDPLLEARGKGCDKACQTSAVKHFL